MDDTLADAAQARFDADMNRHMVWRFRQGVILKENERGICAGAVMEWMRLMAAVSPLPSGNMIVSPEFRQFNGRARELHKTYGDLFEATFGDQATSNLKGYTAAMQKIGLSLQGDGPVFAESRSPRLDGSIFSRAADAGGLWIIGLRSAEEAHAVAVRARGPGARMVDVDFFDPNFGFYRLPNSAALESFCDRLMALYGVGHKPPYTKAMAWQVNPPPLGGAH